MIRRIASRIKWWFRDRFVLPKSDALLMREVLSELIGIMQDEWEDSLQWQDLPDKARQLKIEVRDK